MLRILVNDDSESGESSGSKACAYLEEHGIEANVAPPPQQEFHGAGLRHSGCIKTLIYYRRLGFCASEASRRPTGTRDGQAALRSHGSSLVPRDGAGRQTVYPAIRQFLRT